MTHAICMTKKSTGEKVYTKTMTKSNADGTLVILKKADLKDEFTFEIVEATEKHA